MAVQGLAQQLSRARALPPKPLMPYVPPTRVLAWGPWSRLVPPARVAQGTRHRR